MGIYAFSLLSYFFYKNINKSNHYFGEKEKKKRHCVNQGYVILSLEQARKRKGKKEAA